ncbi:hypothetical protein [Moheibacter lacus]|uniref:Uncharacterized protein n=1 Tax=Moheibacter lacus TaxID=2745851 RepID=A0A838ZR15_9FLAO|nr:hypothetical protein [Moheibacter lacus]MBA5628463.1 hypothetical protein [Moheibacter lacus]
MGTFLRNFIAVILGLAVALVIITFGITLNDNWIEYDYSRFPYEHWNRVIRYAARTPEVRDEFFLALLFSNGVGAIFGGLVTAMIVPKAKKAYAVFVGFILFLIAMGDVIFTPNHPTWYELAILPVLFFFSWLGGLITDLVSKKLARLS